MEINYINGFAGTGKSTLLIEQLNTLAPSATLVLAPTHKALEVLKRKLEKLGKQDAYKLSTMHSLLGWIPGTNTKATNINHVDVTIKLDTKFKEAITNIVIDEFSMISEEMLMELTSKIEDLYEFNTEGITITLYGDAFQLPPVQATPIQLDPDTTTTLTTQYRIESPDIAKLFEKFVNYLQNGGNDLKLDESANVVKIHSLDQFEKGDRFLAYTNRTVGGLNTAIAKRFNIHSYLGQEVQLGNMLETLILEEYVEPSFEELYLTYLQGKLKLQGGHLDSKYIDSSLNNLLLEPNIKFIKVKDVIYPVVEGIGAAYALKAKVKKAAVSHNKGSLAHKKAWATYFALQNAYTMDYTFCSTTHKAQGQEFDRVWIHKADMRKALGPTSNYLMYARMLYVAISRAKKKVFIYGP